LNPPTAGAAPTRATPAATNQWLHQWQVGLSCPVWLMVH
jgi:hypothetical protein